MGLDPQKALIEHDETRNMQNYGAESHTQREGREEKGEGEAKALGG
jgi:hypothetical protein